jgi:hypothetical protein
LPRDVEGLSVAIDNPNIHPGKVALSIMLLDHLGILPDRVGLLAGWWTPPSAIGRDLSIDFDQSFPMAAPAIRHQGRGTVLMGTTPFDLSPQIDGGFRFILSQASSDPQARPRFDQRASPIFPVIAGLSPLVFFPFRPTYVHSPSIWDGPIR